MKSSKASKASFGFSPVAEGAKQGLVNEVFARVARRYDLMNDLMSGGLHRLWKDDLIGWLAPPKGSHAFVLLDVAGGTGDVATRFLRVAGSPARGLVVALLLPSGNDDPPTRRPKQGALFLHRPPRAPADRHQTVPP